MESIVAFIGANWHYVFIATAFLGAGAVVVGLLFVRLKDEIKLNRKIERLSGQMVDEEATRLLKRMRDTTTEDTLLRILPTLAATQKALRQSGLKIDLVGYIAAILVASAIIAFVWNNPAIPVSIDAFEPVVNAIAIHFALSIAILAPIVRMRKARLLQQLSSMISHVSRSLQAGQTVDAAISLAAKAIANPLQREILDVIKLTSVGVPAPEALRAVSANVDLAEYDFFASAIEAADRSGGNLSRVLGELVGVIRARNQLKLKIDAMTAEGKMSAIVLALLPAGIFGWLCYSNPEYVAPLFDREVGQMLLGGACVLIVVGMAVMLRMVRMKV